MKYWKTSLALSILCFLVWLNMGCVGTRNPLFVNVPSAISEAIDEQGNIRTILDSDILREAETLSKAYKQHGNDALLIRNGSNSILSSIAAMSFGLESKILSGLTMGVVGQQSVWDEKSRSITFLQGAAYIDNAIGEYYYNVSERENPLPEKKLSKPGAWLYKRLAAIKAVVNLALIGLVSDANKLALAKGDILIREKEKEEDIDSLILKITDLIERKSEIVP